MLGGGGRSDDDGDDESDDSDLDDPGWRITCKIMDRVDSSEWLRSELGDGGLRRMIFKIATSIIITAFPAGFIGSNLQRSATSCPASLPRGTSAS